MDITYASHYESMSEASASLVLSAMHKKKDLLLCTATGNSPTGLYREMVKKSREDQTLFKALRIVKLDEWCGVPENHPVTCEHYLRMNLLEPLEVAPARYLSFASNPPDLHEECKRVRKALEQSGPIDVCILGLGKNGHIGFNEPAPYLEPFCHVAQLSEDSLQHSMVQSLAKKPEAGLTLGMKEVLGSRKIILLITGKGKKEVIHQLLQEKVSTTLPASFLWLHHDVTCIIDQTALS